MSIQTNLIRQEIRAGLIGRLLDIIRKEPKGLKMIEQVFNCRLDLQKLKNSAKIKSV